MLAVLNWLPGALGCAFNVGGSGAVKTAQRVARAHLHDKGRRAHAQCVQPSVEQLLGSHFMSEGDPV